MSKTKEEARGKRKLSIRKRVNGTAERPRMSVFRSLKHIYVQVIDDASHRTLVAVSDLDEAVKTELKGLKKKDRAAKVDKNLLILSGIDRQALGAAASKIRSFRPPEPYKGKGIKYIEETIIRKAGKTAGK